MKMPTRQYPSPALVRLTSGAVGFVLLAACSGDPIGVQSVPTASQVRVLQSVDEAGAGVIARALALGMKKQSLRLGVRDAMRASPVTEHKLVFKDFAQTPAAEIS